MKKFLAILCAAILCLSAVPCLAAGEDITLVYWDMIWSTDPAYQPAVQALCDKFTEETGIKIDLQFIGWDNHYQTFLTAINAGVGPDVATGGEMCIRDRSPCARSRYGDLDSCARGAAVLRAGQ